MPSDGNSEPRDHARQVLSAAMELPPGERRAYVEAELPPGEQRLDALSLLEEVAGLGSFLATSPLLVADPGQQVLPERIGPFRVERVLGWGSMGVVYLATQDAPRRQVAVKVLRVDVSTPVMAKRFAQEGELLARLSHATIASVYEAGLADLGAGPQPYFAMEYVDGQPINRYAELHHLNRRARVELVVRVAEGVSEAHKHGVLHRDLKPDNVFVREDGEPCILDFGVAHVAADGEDQLTLTATGQVIGTLSYMAPEQARGARLDARADQFALGAILYELFTGELPFDVRGRLPHEALRIIADGYCRVPTQHDATLEGDLVAILMTVLAAEPVRRYPSVEAFAEDLQRWLDGEPVLARPPSRFESLGRFVRRNKALVGVLVIGALGLGAGIGWGTGALLDLRREEAVSLLFADRQSLESLRDSAVDLWPTHSSTLPRFDAWLELAKGLAGRVAQHDQAFGILEEEGADRTAAGTGHGADWLMAESRALVDGVEDFRSGLFLEIQERRALAAGMRSATIDAHLEGWARVRQRVQMDARFGGLELSAQEGLIPLGPDTSSGLEEFALWGSGRIPERDAAGRLDLVAEGALVFVLIPAGEVLIGGQRSESGESNFGDKVGDHEGPPFVLELDPFLISKYELTQAQWVRFAGDNPSDWEIGADYYDNRMTGLHPVESFSWNMIRPRLRRLGLVLPTEAQWELAARADSPWEYLWGPTWRSLIGCANLNTESVDKWPDDSAIVGDSYYSHMPVGSLKPNAYGLYDVIGNVWELCLDGYKVDYHQLTHRAGDGLVIADAEGDVARRGSGALVRFHLASVYKRADKRFDGRDALTGVRPARTIRSRNSPTR